ncbi:MAG TPA: hypothetical protein VMT53_09565 [Terriglobales bacterium]|nr:hypothetical protein [Terriglobales bacterium]
MVATILVNLLLFLPLGAPAQGQAQVYAQTRSPHGPLNLPCTNCHTSLGWKPIRGVPEFDHNQTSFPLRGMHQGVMCTQCHIKPVFSNVGTQCAQCHADIHRGKMSARCEQCHSVNGWNVSVKAIQNHDNRFPLVGAHAALDCDSCHKNGALSNFTTMSTECYSCHAKDFQKATNPNHVTAGFSTSCQQCHDMNTWMSVNFDHLKFTGFALTGTHASLPCTACHVGGNFKGTPATCVGCHLPDYQKTNNPNHAAVGMPQTCQECHTTTAWQPANFDHNLVGFPLTGAHASLQCNQCHMNGNFNLTVKTCVSCHLKDYQNTNNPNHAQQGFSQTCETCHNTAAWIPAQFDHSKSGFPLTGAHAKTPCASCHVNNNYHLTDTACMSCHLKDFQSTTDPNHVQAKFPQTCQQCHNTTSWGNATFNHDSTGFHLDGAHKTLPCAQCHVNGNYNLTSSACVTCHLKDFQGTTNPNHVQASFPQTCQQCHNTTSWGSSTWNHSVTGFALTGTHLTTPCIQCHIGGNYSLTSGACANCHMKDYNGTSDPNHAAAGFPTNCALCHGTVNWSGATFNHATTGWPLTGFHASSAVTCSSCHVNNNYHLTSTACVSCHLKDFQGTTSPNHVASGFPQQCEICHNTSAWIPSTFDHNTTAFPLTGYHIKVPCAQCHVSNNYTSLPTDCYSCHKADYNGTTSPNHAAAGFPTTCTTCHNTTAWIPANWNHTYFPLNHGGANGVCATCHTNPSNYTVFTCTNCHTKTKTDADHRGVGGYVYNSINCYNCHKNGGGG